MCFIDIVFCEELLVPGGYRRVGRHLVLDQGTIVDGDASGAVVGAEVGGMGGVFCAKGGEDFFGEHFESCGAGVLILIDVDGDSCWGGLWWCGGGCGNEGGVGKGVLGVHCGLAWDLLFLCIDEVVAGDG